MIQKNAGSGTSTATPPARARTSPAAAPHTERRADSSRLFSTKNDLPAATRAQVAEKLNARLADCIDLQTQCKQAHWNVKGPNFIALHKLFDEVNEEVEEYVDLLAERIVQLGGVAGGTARMVAQRTTLDEYPTVIDGEAHVDALSSALAAFGSATRKAIDEVEELADADTVDILTEVSRGTDKWLWFVEAHLQAVPEGKH
jgi:starvation-inducible DNA-binding protein